MRLGLGQHGVFALWQLVQLGVPERTVHQWTEVGRVHRLHQGVYALTPRQLLPPRALVNAAVLACGRSAALSHRSAADLLGLLKNRRAKVDVTVAGRSYHKRPGLDIHRSITLIERDVAVVEKIRCTSVARTLLDIAPGVSDGQLHRAFDQSEILGVFDLHAMKDQLKRNPTHRGCRRVRTLLADYMPANLTRSELEDLLLGRLKAAGVALPEVNAYVVLDDGERAPCVDFCWREQRLIVETDGRGTHMTTQAFERDRRNDQRLTAAGWTVIRITWKQLVTEPDRIIQMIVKLLVTKVR